MAVNLDKPQRWKADTQLSVDDYNRWFLEYAPITYRETRARATVYVEDILLRTDNLRRLTGDLLFQHPDALEMLRMSTSPPIARDRLVGLAQVSKSLIANMERHKRISPNLPETVVREQLERITSVISHLIDQDIFIWFNRDTDPTLEEVRRASTVVADRLCGMLTDPLIRNAQEKRQLQRITLWLETRGYAESEMRNLRQMLPGTFAHRVNVTAMQEGSVVVNIPIDTVIMPRSATVGDLPLLVEAKSAGDFTNTNKRRKEEATKMRQLRNAFGDQVRFILLLGGYFDSGYLGYEAAEGIDWVWEHRMDDLAEFGL
ncbi:MAG: XamI family restriction endonuclease [Anaerolineae bacterium]|nr:MAG: XamI family restriction endonuclease [Anaerolineae bacterium]